MNGPDKHPSPDQLHALIEETLDEAERGLVHSHVASCAECGAEVTELRALFAALSSVPLLAPSPGFADRVMEGVRIRRPAFAGASAWIERVTPHTTRGWAAAAALLALPVLGASLLVAWLMSQPAVSAQGLWTLTSGLVGEGVSSGWHWAWARFAGTTVAGSLNQALEIAASVGSGEIGLAAVLFATLTVGSIYVLYENLFRTEGRRTEHASYVF